MVKVNHVNNVHCKNAISILKQSVKFCVIFGWLKKKKTNEKFKMLQERLNLL